MFDPVAVSLVQVGSSGGPDHAYNESARNFEPRVGFAWDAFGNGKMIVRSAYAIFVDQPIVGVVGGSAFEPAFRLPRQFSDVGHEPKLRECLHIGGREHYAKFRCPELQERLCSILELQHSAAARERLRPHDRVLRQ